MTITPEDLVRREVHYCVSSLVSTLASGYGAPHVSRDLDDLAEQAMELCSPIPDYEEAAREEGWDFNPEHETFFKRVRGHAVGYDNSQIFADDWAGLCCRENIDPYEREVFEHWIVSNWLADKLAEKGEKVDKDFAGLTVWARTTTGQAIASDWVIEQIVADLNKEA